MAEARIFVTFIRNKNQKTKFLRGFERDGAKTSGFFKLQKIRTGKNFTFGFLVCPRPIRAWIFSIENFKVNVWSSGMTC